MSPKGAIIEMKRNQWLILAKFLYESHGTKRGRVNAKSSL